MVKEPYAVIDTQHAPIVHVKVVAEPNDANYPEYLARIGEEFRKHERFALIFNTGELSAFPARYRDMQSRWLADTRAEFEGRWLAAAFVIPNRFIRGVLMTLFWVNPPYYVHTVVASDEEAWCWTREKFAEAGIDLGAGAA